MNELMLPIMTLFLFIRLESCVYMVVVGVCVCVCGGGGGLVGVCV